jgi:predicted GNAT family acetyltransferase
MSASLERPIWSALTTHHAHLGYGNAIAHRYDADVAPFAAVASESREAFDALHGLMQADEQVALLSAQALPSFDAFENTELGKLVQMVAMRPIASKEDVQVERLTPADVKDMLALVDKTKPGPFGTRTIETGNYIGIRNNSQLVAMAGERMRLEGYVEISAVCVDDDWRGKGLAGKLMRLLQSDIEGRGSKAFLHVFAHNASAITLYERLGYEISNTFHLTRVKRAS